MKAYLAWPGSGQVGVIIYLKDAQGCYTCINKIINPLVTGAFKVPQCLHCHFKGPISRAFQAKLGGWPIVHVRLQQLAS